jgi:hypothetical protein
MANSGKGQEDKEIDIQLFWLAFPGEGCIYYSGGQ